MNLKEINSRGGAEGFLLIKQCEKKTTAKGAVYLDMVLADSTGEISAKLWDYNEEAHGMYEAGMLVKVRGTVSQYNGADQLRVERIRKTVPSDGVRLEDFVPSAEYSGAFMLGEIIRIVEAFSDADIKAVVLELLGQYRESLLTFPAAFKLHHAIRGGLLMHTLSIVRLAEGVCRVYPFADKELLIAGAILHDIAKVYEYEVSEAGIASGYTVEGTLIGHLVRGAMLIEEAAKKLGTPQDKAMLLEHMVLSHHGEPDFGAAVRPMFLEAELLSQLDMMDARVYQMAEAVAPLEKGEFSNRLWALDNRKMYNHARTDLSQKVNLE